MSHCVEGASAVSGRQRYRKKTSAFIIAVQLKLDTEGFFYHKWGGVQRCKSGDWLLDNEGDIYTVDQDVFRKTYRAVGPGRYVKTTPIWAEVARVAGTVETIEGSSAYSVGDYIVSNNKDGTDSYCVGKEKFLSMYELDE